MCCGWYYDCFTSSLWSGPPHNYGWPKMKYGPAKTNGKYLKEGSVITALLDPIKRELAFRLDGISYGAAYTELPLDKPLVPCVILGNKGDSVEFFVRKPEKVMKELPINPPENLVAKEVGLNSVTIAWSSVPNIKFYQVEIDWAEHREISQKNVFKKEGLLPDTSYTFRVRAVCKKGFSDWSKPFNVKTAEPPDFSTCAWKKLPRMFSLTRRYALDPDNPRIVTKVISSGWSFVIGTVQIPLGKIAQWGIKSLNGGSEFCVGVARYDADITISGPHEFGWYYYCYDSTLYSEAPHNYREKEYGPRRVEGEYVHKGDTVGVVMNTENGNLSFIVGGVNLGVAFEGIPLDKPLTPYVILYHEDDSLEFSPGRVEENVDHNNRVPLIYISNVTWNSFIVSWVVSDPHVSYQVEVNGYLLQAVIGDNILVDRLNPATFYNIRVRVVNRGSVGLWSDYMSVRTELAPFSSCAWKRCPAFVDIWKKYELDAQNPSIATCRNHNDWHTLISEVTIPLKMTSSWRIRIVHSKGDDGRSIYTGVAPYDIDQNGNSNITVSGWYLYCCNSSLYSGPPHNNKWKPYGPRLGEGNYVHTGSAVDVTMNMKKGCLSFSIDGVDYGIAFSAIPLDKPLVAATILYHEGDSVEMTFLRNIEE